MRSPCCVQRTAHDSPFRIFLVGCPKASTAPRSVPSFFTAKDPILQSPLIVNTAAAADEVRTSAATRATVAVISFKDSPSDRLRASLLEPGHLRGPARR